jgi:hypothetical protein
MINGPAGVGATFAIWDKQGGVLVNETPLGTLAPPGSPCTLGGGDPIVLHDPLANRWLMSEAAHTPDGQPGFLCVYISKSADPATGDGGATSSRLQASQTIHYAVWPDAYYVGVNENHHAPGDAGALP